MHKKTAPAKSFSHFRTTPSSPKKASFAEELAYHANTASFASATPTASALLSTPVQRTPIHKSPGLNEWGSEPVPSTQSVRTRSTSQENKTGLPDQLKAGIERLSGLSLNDVKVHYNSDRPARFQALAYAQGSEIHLAPRQETHLAHEAWHVVQQKQGRVRTRWLMMGGTPINNDPELEREADAMGQRALDLSRPLFTSHRELTDKPAQISSPIQRSSIDSVETDDENHGPYGNLELGTESVDWSELDIYTLEQEGRLGAVFAVFIELVNSYIPHLMGGLTMKTMEDAFGRWMGNGPFTRAKFKTLINQMIAGPGLAMDIKPDDATREDILQAKRSGNTYSYQEEYKTRNRGDFKNVYYLRDREGNIEFDESPTLYLADFNRKARENRIDLLGGKLNSKKIKWKDPILLGSDVELSSGMKGGKGEGLMPSGKKVKLANATRSQHFAIADSIFPNNRTGKWTWHHLSEKYKMILVDMTVHAKHGHNGGIYLWK